MKLFSAPDVQAGVASLPQISAQSKAERGISDGTWRQSDAFVEVGQEVEAAARASEAKSSMCCACLGGDLRTRMSKGMLTRKVLRGSQPLVMEVGFLSDYGL